jgi:YfiH family protein
LYAFRTTIDPAGPGSVIELAFTDRYGGVSGVPYDELNLALETADDAAAVAENWRLLLDDFAPGATLAGMRQVHGNHVEVVTAAAGQAAREARHAGCDGLVTPAPDVVLAVRVADCVPVLLADQAAGVLGAAHAGRLGLVAGVVPATVDRMRERGADEITAWIGPHICSACYEVPEEMRSDVASVEPATHATTSWGTPSLDLGAGIRAQLERLEVEVVDASRCTRESGDLYSFRRDGAAAGRQVGLIGIRS